ncbi:MAG: hypothetical protein ACREVA_00270 [Burkholderiales bacterium]
MIDLIDKPGRAPLTIVQGACLDIPIFLTNDDGTIINLTGYTAYCQGREQIDSAVLLFDLKTSNGSITIDGPAGKVTLLFTAAMTDAVNRPGLYDLFLVQPGGCPIKILEGPVLLNHNVTVIV